MNVVLGMALLLLIAVFSIITSKEKGNRRKKGARWIHRWSRKKAGKTIVGRVLPKAYKWYAGDGKHNYFRNQYQGGTRWNYSLPSPYEN